MTATIGMVFRNKWKYTVEDAQLRDLSLHSPVGRECYRVIAAADALITLCTDVDPDPIVAAAVEQCLVFLHA